MEWGLAVKKITYSNLGLAINGSRNLPAGYLKDPLDALERAWESTSDPSLNKKNSNYWLGLFANDEHYSYVEKMFRSEDLLPSYGGMTRQHHYSCGLVSVGYRVEQVIARSHRPYHQWCIDQEHLAMARILFMFQTELGLPPRAFRELRVDSILLQAGTKNHREIRARRNQNTNMEGFGFSGR